MTTGRLAPWRQVRATPPAVWLLCLVQLLLAASYALSVPLLHAPDEHAHVDRILSGDPGDLDPLEDDPDLSERTLALLPRAHLIAIDWRVAPRGPWQGLAEEEAPPRKARPAYEEVAPARDSGTLNNAANHPPLYYLYAAGGLRGVRALVRAVAGEAVWSWDRTVVVLRLLSALLVLPLPWLAHWTAVRVGGRREVGTVAAAAPLAVPQLAHVTGSVNNDALLVLTASVVVLGCAWIATGDRSAITAALTGGAAGLALLTKVFALGAPLWIAGAYAVGWARSRRGNEPWSGRSTAASLAIAALATVALGGWYVVRLLLVHGTPAPRRFAYPRASVEADLGSWLATVWSRGTATFWGSFGIEQFPLPRWSVVALTLVAVTAVAGAVVAGRWSAPRWRVADLLVLLLPVGTTAAMMLYASWQGYARTGLPVGIHGRYLFVGLVGLAAAVALGVDAAVGSRRSAPWVLLAALAAQAAAGWTVLRSFWAGAGPVAEVGALLAFAPFRPRYVVGLWAVLGLTAVAAVWRLRAPPRGHPGP